MHNFYYCWITSFQLVQWFPNVFSWTLTFFMFSYKLTTKQEVRASNCMHLYRCISNQCPFSRLLLWAGYAKPKDRNQAFLDSGTRSAIQRFTVEPDCWVCYLQGSIWKSILCKLMEIQWIPERVVCWASSGKHLKQQYPKTVNITTSWDCIALPILYNYSLTLKLAT